MSSGSRIVTGETRRPRHSVVASLYPSDLSRSAPRLKSRVRSGAGLVQPDPAMRQTVPAGRSATAGAQDDVGDVGGAGRRVDARFDRVPLDGEVVAEQPAEVVGADVVRRVDAL